MVKEHISIDELLNKIIDSGAVAITVEMEAINQGLVILTVYPNKKLDLNRPLDQIDTVLIQGIPSGIVIEQSDYGIDTLGRTIVYLQEDVSVKFTDGSKITGRTLEEGLNKLIDSFLDFAVERAWKEKQALLDEKGETVDTNVLYELSQYQNPDKTFYSPSRDSSISIYNIGGYQYALYFDGGVREAYKFSTRVETLSEELKKTNYWQSNPAQAGLASAEA